MVQQNSLNKRNRSISAKNTTNLRAMKTPKSPFLTDLGGESKGKEPRRVHAYIPQQILKRTA
jgi:hypothetical protein